MIIDFHTHAFPSAIAEKAMKKLAAVAGVPYYGDGTAEAVTKNLEKCGADMAVIHTIATRPDNLKKINDYAVSHDGILSGDGKYAKAVRFCGIHQDAPDALEEMERLHKLGVKGIKLHPDYQDFMIDDKKLYPIYDAARSMGLIVVFHAGWDPLSPDLVHAPPERSAKVLRDFPGMKTVLAHLGGMKMYGEVRDLLAGKFPDLYVDTSMSRGIVTKELMTEIIKRQGADKVLFGSDFPWHESLYELELVESLDISRSEKDLIEGENARALLGL